MKLFHAKGSCSLGIIVLIEELGIECELQVIDLAKGQHHEADYLAINPKGKIPALLLDDGETITEWPAIATYLAELTPERAFIPEDPRLKARVYEATDFLVATTHMQGFTRIVRPGNFTPTEDDFETVKARGLEIFEEGLRAMDKVLADNQYLIGEISIADCALFYCEAWMVTRLGGPLPTNCKAHFERMLARPTVAQAMLRAG